MKAKYIIVLVCCMFMFSCSNGQVSEGPIYDKVIPGQAEIEYSKIQPHKIEYKKMGGKMIYDLKKVNKYDKEVYEMNIYFGNESGTPDKIYFDINSLEYVGRVLDLKDYIIDVSFKESVFKGNLKPKGGSDYKPVDYNKEYPHNGFEPAIINYYIAALPLKMGYTASIPTFDLNGESSMIWANIKVVDEEIVKVAGKKYDTWKVSSIGIREKTIWISKDLGYAVKMKTKGAGGTWKLNKVF
ncbi:hypothetical protein [uncultured Psychroserpens sp.]|uniref:DUF3108 domain-containing protein n=1 Tax=uncultured Psychroserpens sp. TaxID=255436 RepID=UPI00262E1659|nr:hypothetical protein [uncultured Psychroserpens sp.]